MPGMPRPVADRPRKTTTQANRPTWANGINQRAAPALKRPVMQIYLFISKLQPSVRAFTSDPAGGNLPAEYAPWRPIIRRRMISAGSKDDPIMVGGKRRVFPRERGRGAPREE
jgi:hypothetical protein